MSEYITVISAKRVRGGVVSVKTDMDEYLYAEIKGLLPRADGRRTGSTDEYRHIYLNPAVAESHGIKPGARLEYEELTAIIEESNFARAKSKALFLLTGRDYSSGGLVKKLCESFPRGAAESACSEMLRLGLIHEEDFGRRLAEEYICRKGMSRRHAVIKLKEKGFDGETAEALVSGIEHDPVESIRRLIAAKYKEIPSDAAGRRKMYAMLYRKGFSAADISAAVGEISYDE